MCNVVYLEDCAALTFLQNIQELIKTEIGLSSAIADVSSLSDMEEMSSQSSKLVLENNSGDVHELKVLVDVFFTSVHRN